MFLIDTATYVLARPKLALVLVTLPMFIPVVTFRLAYAAVTGHLTLKPIKSNIDFRISDRPKMFLYCMILFAFLNFVSILGLWAAVKVVVSQPT